MFVCHVFEYSPLFSGNFSQQLLITSVIIQSLILWTQTTSLLHSDYTYTLLCPIACVMPLAQKSSSIDEEYTRLPNNTAYLIIYAHYWLVIILCTVDSITFPWMKLWMANQWRGVRRRREDRKCLEQRCTIPIHRWRATVPHYAREESLFPTARPYSDDFLVDCNFIMGWAGGPLYLFQYNTRARLQLSIRQQRLWEPHTAALWFCRCLRCHLHRHFSTISYLLLTSSQ